jgi:hypothetical protein
MDDKTRTFTSPSIFGLLGQHNLGWAIYGYDYIRNYHTLEGRSQS